MACQAILKCMECLAHTCLWSPEGAGECSHISFIGKYWLKPGIDALKCQADATDNAMYSFYQLGTATAAGGIIGAGARLLFYCVYYRWGGRRRLSDRNEDCSRMGSNNFLKYLFYFFRKILNTRLLKYFNICKVYTFNVKICRKIVRKNKTTLFLIDLVG